MTYGPCICVNELFGIAGAGVAAVDVAVLDVTGALVLVVVALDVAVLDVTGAVVLVVVVLDVGTGSVTDDWLLAVPGPEAFSARTSTAYVIPALSPLSVDRRVLPEPLVVVTFCQVVPPSVLAW